MDAEEKAIRHLIVGRLIERVEVSAGYKVHIKFRITLKRFPGQA